MRYDRFIAKREALTGQFLLSLLLTTLLLSAPPSALAQDQVFTVTNSNSTGAGSLWQAVLDANAASPNGSHTIQFDSGLGQITPPRQIFVSANITFVGNNSTISGGNVDRIFFVAGGNVEFQDLNLINGRAKGGNGGGGGNDFGNSAGAGGGAGLGGAIFAANGFGISGSGVAQGTNVTVRNVTFSNNTAIGGNGGAAGTPFAIGGGGGGMGGDGGESTILHAGGGGFGNQATGGRGTATLGGPGDFDSAPTVWTVLTGGGGAGGYNGIFDNASGGGVGVSSDPLLRGNGGFGGGGLTAGNGGFGGGGGAGAYGYGGNGGFGGGGGGGVLTDDPNKGRGGFGAGDSYTGTIIEQGGGGGGLGAGGAVFVMNGAQFTVIDSGFSNNTVAGGAGGVAQAGSGSAFGAALFLGGTTTISISANQTRAISESIGGAYNPNANGGLIKTGAGTLSLSGVNDFVGGTTVNGGVLEVNAGTALGDGFVTVNAGATLQSTASLSRNRDVKADGAGAAITAATYLEFGTDETGGSLQVLNGASAVSGTTTAFGVLTGASGSGNIAGANSRLDVGTTLFLGYLGSGTLSVGTGGTLSVGQQIVIGSQSTGSGSLAINAGGTVEVGGTNGLILGDGGGGVTLGGGTLKVTGSDLTTGMGLSLTAASTIDTNGRNAALSGNLSGSGGLTKTGLGTLTLSGTNNYIENTVINGGTLAVTNESNIGGSVNTGTVFVLSGGRLAAADTLQLNRTVTVDGAGSALTTGSYLEIGASGNGNLTITNGGQVTSTTSTAFGMLLPGGLGEGLVTGTNSQLNVGGLLTVGYFNTGILTVASGGSITASQLALGVQAGGSGAFVLNSGGTLNVGGVDGITRGAGAYGFYLSGGTLKVTNSSLTTSADMTLTNSSLIDTSGVEGTLSGTLSGNGSLSKTGAGTLHLTGTNTYSGGTTLIAGTLILDGTLGSGEVNIASSSTLGGNGTIGGSLHFDSGANLIFDANESLTINGTSVTFDGFGVENLVGLDSSVSLGTYTLLAGSATFDFTYVDNFGLNHAYAIGGGKFAYFEQGSLQLTVVPEPSTWALLVVGVISGILLKRKRQHLNADPPTL